MEVLISSHAADCNPLCEIYIEKVKIKYVSLLKVGCELELTFTAPSVINRADFNHPIALTGCS